MIFLRLVSKTDVSEAVLSLLKVSQVPALVALNKDLSLLGMEETASFCLNRTFLIKTRFFLINKIKSITMGLIERLSFIGRILSS
jgi:hypothetical protein